MSCGSGVLGRLRNQPMRPKMPARRPISTATIANGAAYCELNGGGRTYVQSRFVRRPVSMPATGPATTPTKIVPIESR